MTAILFGGAEMSAFTPSDSTALEETDTFSSPYNSNFARVALRTYGGTSYVEATPSASATDIWIHFDLWSGNTALTTSSTMFSWYDSSGNERFRLDYAAASSNLVTIKYWNGSAFVSAGTIAMEMDQTRQTFDINVLCNSGSGSINVYVSGTNRLAASVSTSSITNLKKFRFWGVNIGAAVYETKASQIIVTDGVPTVGWRGAIRYPNGAGATTDWTGDYTAVDEAVYNDADFINSSVADQVELVTGTGPSLTGYTVRAVCVSARAKRGASGPANIRLALRSGGTTYFSGSDIALGLGYAPVQTIWETDPATASSWLTSAITTLQFGVKSIT